MDDPWNEKDRAVSAIHKGIQADKMIEKEVALQDAMWGIANDRADVGTGQMIEAAVASATYVQTREEMVRNGVAVDPEELQQKVVNFLYPRDWSGFRDYGTPVSNLVVAAAYLRQEIKRRLMLGEDATRTDRPKDRPYSPQTTPAFTTADPDWQDKVLKG